VADSGAHAVLSSPSSSKRILLGGWLLEVRKWVDDYAAAKAAASQLTQAGVARGGGRGVEAGAGAFVGAAPPPRPAGRGPRRHFGVFGSIQRCRGWASIPNLSFFY
jgi:hypothetical protein